MNLGTACRCCLVRPPENDLKKPYTSNERTEIYADLLRECFEIHILSGADDVYQGICGTCVCRLRDAFDFKQQVVRCQGTLQMIKTRDAEDEAEKSTVKEEFPDNDEDNYCMFYDADDIKEELPDLDSLQEDFLSLDKVKLKCEAERKKNGSKRSLVLEKRNGTKTKKNRKILLKGLTELDVLSDDEGETVSETMQYKLNIQNILKYSNCTPFFNKSIAGIACAYCKELYKDIRLLSDHTNESHERGDIDNKRYDKDSLSIKIDITDLKCNICNANLNVISDLKTHLTKEHRIKFYPVYDCFVEFKLTDSSILNCALCTSTFETFKMLLQHMNGHYRNYICDVCDLGFINRQRLKIHKKTHDVGDFKCTFCDKVFSTKVRQKCHEKYSHNTGPRYTTNCSHCDKSFTSYYQRNRHMNVEHQISAATYKCNICETFFILKSKLTSHIKKVHLMERNHICAQCGLGFFTQHSLDDHMVKHNGERVFECTVCHKAYARKKTLREHMRIHNNDRRFKCGVCEMAFVQKCSLKSHMLSNHGVTLVEFESGRHDINRPGN